MRLSRSIAAVVVVVVGLGLASPALADLSDDPTYVAVKPPKVDAGEFGAGAKDVDGERRARARRGDGGLPVTGGDVFGLAALGLVLVGSGAAVRRLGRPQPPHAA